MGNMTVNSRMHEVKLNINYNEFITLRGFGSIREYRESQVDVGKESTESIEVVMYKDFKSRVSETANMIINSRMQEIKLYMYFHEYILFRGFVDIDNFVEYAIVDRMLSVEEMIYSDFKNAIGQ